jgi:hypothetical protein
LFLSQSSALGIAPLGPYSWVALGTLILGGGYFIWWITERAWGKFSTPTHAKWE